jgi:aldose 1-epimerase
MPNRGNARTRGVLPSGEQVPIQYRNQRATVVTVGGGLRTYDVDGAQVVDGYGSDEMCESGRGQLLIPWPNRLRMGRYTWDGEEQQLPLSEPRAGNAIHGLVRWSSWDVLEHEESRAVLGYHLYPQTGYPFALTIRAEYTLDGLGLTVRLSATNVGGAACPFGAGAHPYLTAGAASVDASTLRVPAQTRLRIDDHQIPIGAAPVDNTELDFRSERAVGQTVIDTAYTDLARDERGRALVELRSEKGTVVTLWMDRPYAYVMVFTGDTLPRERRRRSLAVEPMTCAPNAFQSGDGLLTLLPGESFAGAWGISVGQ